MREYLRGLFDDEIWIVLADAIEIIDKIAAVTTDSRNRPIKDIRMRIYLLENK